MTGGVQRSFILQTQKNTQAWNFRPKKIPGIKISNPKKTQEHGTHVAEKKFEWIFFWSTDRNENPKRKVRSEIRPKNAYFFKT